MQLFASCYGWNVTRLEASQGGRSDSCLLPLFTLLGKGMATGSLGSKLCTLGQLTLALPGEWVRYAHLREARMVMRGNSGGW